MTKVCAFIFARGGSKGLPNKNILPIGGIPLVAHSIRIAKKINQIHSIYVSTDSSYIGDIAEEAGAHVIYRPFHLATDDSPEWLSWQHAINEVHKIYGSFDIFLSLPTTAPLRSVDDVQRSLKALQPDVDIVLTMSHARRSPWFNMVTLQESGTVNLVSPDGTINRRQDAPECFDLTTVAYVSRPQFILSANSMWDGNVAGVLIPPERAIDIDNQLDFQIATMIYEHGLQS